MIKKRFTYLDASRNKYIGSFFSNGVSLKNYEVANYLNEFYEYKNNVNRILQTYYDMNKEIDTDCQLVVLSMIQCIAEEMGVELKSLKIKNTKHKLIANWIKNNVQFNSKKKYKPLFHKKRWISITLDDDFGRVHTRIKTRYNASELMDKIVKEYEERKWK